MQTGTLYHYMGTPQNRQVTVTGLLSKGERAFFRGEKDVDDPDGYKRNARYRARKRMNEIEEDLELLREAGQEDLVDDFLNRFEPTSQLEQRIDELEQILEE